VPFATRGARLDEAIEVVRRLWSEPLVAHSGRFYAFPEVAFEPKPVQRRLPVLAGGESAAALRRAATLCDGWISMPHTIESIKPQLARLGAGTAVTAHAYELASPGEVDDWAALGVERLIVRPWTRSRDAVSRLAAFADEYGVRSTS
jgi:alkanesulfonate monooxygenase SsuD/methylene tetrahydromethanopterin reductase-like flavin-dependent oxidoreductase (luciferase family)